MYDRLTDVNPTDIIHFIQYFLIFYYLFNIPIYLSKIEQRKSLIKFYPVATGDLIYLEINYVMLI